MPVPVPVRYPAEFGRKVPNPAAVGRPIAQVIDDPDISDQTIDYR